jgi:hypothetical protein
MPIPAIDIGTAVVVNANSAEGVVSAELRDANGSTWKITYEDGQGVAQQIWLNAAEFVVAGS